MSVCFCFVIYVNAFLVNTQCVQILSTPHKQHKFVDKASLVVREITTTYPSFPLSCQPRHFLDMFCLKITVIET